MADNHLQDIGHHAADDAGVCIANGLGARSTDQVFISVDRIFSKIAEITLIYPVQAPAMTNKTTGSFSKSILLPQIEMFQKHGPYCP